MRTSTFDFELPEELIAQRPVEPRDAARLLVAGPGGGREGAVQGTVAGLGQWLREGDLLVVNDTRVLPARVMARRASGGRVEALFLEPGPSVAEGRDGWTALVRPAKKLKEGESLQIEGTAVRLVAQRREPGTGGWIVHLEDPDRPERSTAELLEEVGSMPLPPYIGRPADGEDQQRYQTVYARAAGAVAAPTAGLHFTEQLLERLEALGVERASVTLHVGAGTFRPVTAETLADHRMHSERFELGEETAARVAAAKERGGRVIPVGTTSARTLESCWDPDSGLGSDARVRAGRGATEIFIHPGSPPRVCDALFTNFHLPKSTLLMLVAAFTGVDEALALYRLAISERFRFYSYGDAMLVPRVPRS